MNTTVVPDILQETVNRADNAPFSSDIMRRARIAGGIFDRNHDGVADLIFPVGGFHCSLNPAGL